MRMTVLHGDWVLAGYIDLTVLVLAVIFAIAVFKMRRKQGRAVRIQSCFVRRSARRTLGTKANFSS